MVLRGQPVAKALKLLNMSKIYIFTIIVEIEESCLHKTRTGLSPLKMPLNSAEPKRLSHA